MTGLTAATLRAAMGGPLSLARYQELLPSFTRFLLAADCTTVRRVAMAIAQTGHESVGLRYQREIWGPTTQQRRYGPESGSSLARQLGNTRPGDGRRFAGHGWLQVTGRANHTTVSRWAHARGYVPSPTFFVDEPAELGSDRYAWIGPAWYWTSARPKLNARADAGDVVGATKMINGGTYGLADRRRRYEACLRLGDRLLPGAASASPTVVPPPPAPAVTPALGTELVMDPMPMTGRGARRFFLDPPGARVIEAAWLSLVVDGPNGAVARVTAWPQKPGGGTGPRRDLKAGVLTDGSNTTTRDAWQLPAGTDQVQLQWEVSAGATAYMVPAMRAAK